MRATKVEKGKFLRQGFSLVELMVVLVIIALLAMIALQNLMDATNRAKQRATVAELRNWALGISAYMAERGVVPPAITPGGILVSTIHTDLVPYAVSALHDQDAWKHDMEVFSTDSVSYTVISRARDGLPSPCITPATFRNWDEDIVISDGLFVCSPS